MKRKLLLRKLSISAPRMTVRSTLPWSLRLLIWIITPLAFCGALVLGAYALGRHAAAASPAAPTIDWTKLSETQRSQLVIDQSAQARLIEYLKTLEAENVRLKEDLAFFNNLVPARLNHADVTIQGLEAAILIPNQLRFRALLMQGANSRHRFVGKLQIVVTAEQGNQTVHLIFPDEKSSDANAFKIGFQHYQRLEGILNLPEGIMIKQVQARVFANGQLRAHRVTDLPVKS